MIDEFNDFLSDWSHRSLEGQPFDAIFNIEGIPLSWVYRPILYSSLLPRPLLSAREILHQKKNCFSQGLFPTALASSLEILTKLKPQLFRRKVSSSLREKIIFLTFTNHVYFSPEENIPKLEKVITTLREGPYEPFLLTVDPLSSFSIHKLRRCSHVPYQYHTPKISGEAARYAADISRQWKNIPEQTKQSWMTYKSTNLWKAAKANLDFLYSRQFVFVVAYYYLLFKEILLTEKIRAIVLTGQNNIFEKCMIAAAKRQNLPVLIIQHGIGMGTFKTVDPIHNEIFAVWGDCFKESLLKLGLPPQRMVVTGNLAFDDLTQEKEKPSSRRNRPPPVTNRWDARPYGARVGSFGVPEFSPVTDGSAVCTPPVVDRVENSVHFKQRILVTTGCYIEDRFLEKEDYFKVIRKVVTDLEQLDEEIVIKLHPREKFLKEYQRIIAGKPQFTVVRDVSRGEYNRLLGEAKIIVTFGSSILLEAIARGKQTMIIDPFTVDSPLPLLFPHVGATPCRRWNEELVPTFRNLLAPAEKPAPEEISRLLYKIDGQAYRRVAEAIHSLLGSSPSGKSPEERKSEAGGKKTKRTGEEESF